MHDVLTPQHVRWPEFVARLCQHVVLVPPAPDDEIDWLRCDGDTRRTEEILRAMGMDVDHTLAVFESLGGCCDCAVLFTDTVWEDQLELGRTRQ